MQFPSWKKAAIFFALTLITMAASVSTYQMFEFRNRLHDQTDNARVRATLAENHFYGARKIVFFGDSQLALWQLRPSFGVMPIVNKGISGDWAVKAINRFDADVLAENPTGLVILIGTNDIGNAQPERQTVESVEEMLRRATARKIKIVVCGLLPSRDAQHPIEQLSSINRAYKSLAEKYGAEFVDFTGPLSDEQGLLRPELTRDGLHANDSGYLIMARTLYPYLARLAI